VCSVIRDIAERKQAEKALKKSEKKYRDLVDNTLVGIFTADIKGNILYVNETLIRMLGFESTEEIISEGVLARYKHPEERDVLIERLKQEGPVKDFEVEILTKTNKAINVLLSAVLDGDFLSGMIMNITERKRIEEELTKSHEQLRSLSAHLQSVREESQKLLAREIHDELGQDLTALKMDLSWLKGRLRQDQKFLREKAAAMTELSDAMIQTVKRITARLRPALLDNLGVEAALEWEVGEFAKRTGIGYELAVEPKELNLDSDRYTVVYRIFQEALTNIARHAQATSVEAALRVGSGRLEMEISDNGAGITEEQIASPRSFGIIGIRERVLQWGGEAVIKGIKGRGTTLTVTIPLDNGESHNDQRPGR